MSEFPPRYRDDADEGSERSSAYTDEAGYQSSSDGPPRRSTGSMGSSEDRHASLPLRPGSVELDRAANTTGCPDVAAAAPCPAEPLVVEVQESLRVHDSPHRASPAPVPGAAAPSDDAPGSLLPRDDTIPQSIRTQPATVDGFRAGPAGGPAPTDRQTRDQSDPSSHPGGQPSGGAEPRSLGAMGPPLSRALLPQRSHLEKHQPLVATGRNVASWPPASLGEAAQAAFTTSTTRSEAAQQYTSGVSGADSFPQRKHLHHHPSDEAMDDGSQTDDCGGSLDVETHSIHSMGNRSTYSQDDGSQLHAAEAEPLPDGPDGARYGDSCRSPGAAFSPGSDGGRYDPEHHLVVPVPLAQCSAEEVAYIMAQAHHQNHPLPDRLPGWHREGHYRQRRARHRSRSRSRSPGADRGDPDAAGRRDTARDHANNSWDHRGQR